MAYNKVTYVDGETPLNASNLNKNEVVTEQISSDLDIISRSLVEIDTKVNTHGHKEYATVGSLDVKVDKVDGKSLSTNDYTNDEKAKLAGLKNSDVDKAYVDTELEKKSPIVHTHGEYCTTEFVNGELDKKAPVVHIHSDINALIDELLDRIVKLEQGSTTPPPPESDGTLDVVIVFGQSNSVCYTGSNGATLDVQAPDGCYEYRPSKNNIQPLRNPIGESPSNAGASMGYTTGGTFFSTLAKQYKEKTGRNVCILPCGNPGVSSSTYYQGGGNYNMLMGKYNSFKAWIGSQQDHTLGRVVAVWHQGESGTGDSRNIKDSFNKVFGDLKIGIPELDQVFFCRIAQNDACDNNTTKNYNALMKQLNDDTDWVLVADCMKYYWLNQFADVHHYDQHACNDLGTIIGDNIVQYYAMGKVKPNIKPFEFYKGDYPFTEFKGITITDNQLASFKDSIDKSKVWALCSRLYETYATISPIALTQTQQGFDFRFNLKLGDKETNGATLVPILAGGSSHISINSSQIVVSDGTHTITLNHGLANRISRGGNITKTLTDYKYRIVKDGTNLKVYANDVLKSTQAIPSGFSATFNMLGRKANTYLEGIITDISLSSDGTVVDPPEPPTSDFAYEDKVKGTVISTPSNVVGGLILPSTSDTASSVVKLDKPLELRSNEVWEMKFKFKPTKLGVANYFTILGNEQEKPIKGIEALQISDQFVRFYSNAECERPHNLGSILTLGSEHTMYIACGGDGHIHFKINSNDTVDLGTLLHPNNVVGNYDILGQCINTGNMGHEGEFSEIKIYPTPTIIGDVEPPVDPPVDPPTEGKFKYTDTILGSVFDSATEYVDGEGNLINSNEATPHPRNVMKKDLELKFGGTKHWNIKLMFTPKATSYSLMGNKEGASTTTIDFNNTNEMRLYPIHSDFKPLCKAMQLDKKHTVDIGFNGEPYVKLDGEICEGFDMLKGQSIVYSQIGGWYAGGYSNCGSSLIHSINVSESTEIPPEPPVEGEFEYVDEVYGTSLTKPTSANDKNELIIESTGMVEPLNYLDKNLVLKGSDTWEIQTEFTPTKLGVMSGWTLVGSKSTGSIIATQFVDGNRLRMYNGDETEMDVYITFPTPINFTLGQKHSVKLACKGDSKLHLQINNGEVVSADIPLSRQEKVSDCGVLGQSYFSGGLQGHSGTIHIFKIVSEPTIIQKDSTPSLASQDGAIYEVSIDEDGVLNTIPTTGSFSKEAQLVSPNGTLYDISVDTNGVLSTTVSDIPKSLFVINANNFTLDVDDDGVLVTN